MRIAIYSRKSRTSESGDSIRNQITMCKDYANLHFPNSTFTVYEDEGFSGGNIDRPKFKQLIKHIKNNEFDVLICYRLDRISRNVADFSTTLNLLQSYKVDFVSIKENFDTSTPMGTAMMYISSVFAQLERDTIAERITDNLLALARTGSGRYLAGTAPFGYKKVKKTNKDGKVYSTLDVIPSQAEIVKLIFDKYLEFQSLGKVESYLFINNIKTKNNCNFDANALNILLRRPTYTIADNVMYKYYKKLGVQLSNSESEFNGKNGINVFGRSGGGAKGKISKLAAYSNWVVGVGEHKGIIESSKWLHVQKVLDYHKGSSFKRTHGHYGLLNGILKCSNCGNYMRPTGISGKTGKFYYKCITKEKSLKSKCDIKNIQGNMLDKDIIDRINIELNDMESKSLGLNEKQNILEKKLTKSNEKEKQLKKELKENEQSIKNLIQKLSENNSTTIEKYILKEVEALDNRNKDIEVQLIELINDKENIELENANMEIVQQAKKQIKTFNNSNIDMLSRRSLLKTVIRSIDWDGQKIKINFYI